MMTSAERIRHFEYALTAALAEVRPGAVVDVRLMFGGAGFYVDGRIFAAWFGRGLALKMNPSEGEALIQNGGTASPEARFYIEVPESFLNDPAGLAPWVGKSVVYVLSLPHKKRSSKTKSKSQAD